MKDKSTLIKTWRENTNMPGVGHGFLRGDAKRVLEERMSRETFLGMTRLLGETAQAHGKNYGKVRGRGQGNDERGRGGRSR